ncbi:hypothetical protein ACU686_05690 [Yinghuangia aomiensis]
MASWSDLWLSEGHAVLLSGCTPKSTAATRWKPACTTLTAPTTCGAADYGPPAAPIRAEPVQADALRRLRARPLRPRARRSATAPSTPSSAPGSAATAAARRAPGTSSTSPRQVAHRDLRPFLDAWLYAPTTPPMPGHPDWKVDPLPPAGS